MNKTLEDRFFEKTEWNGDCLEWTAARHPKGYGQFSIKHKMKAAHKVAWQIKYGYWPDYLLHSCDNPPCVNTEHLREGTHADNMADRQAKGRLNRSPNAGKPALTPELIQAIRDLRAEGKTFQQIHEELDVSTWTAHKYGQEA